MINLYESTKVKKSNKTAQKLKFALIMQNSQIVLPRHLTCKTHETSILKRIT